MPAIVDRVCNAKPGIKTLELHHNEYNIDKPPLAARPGNGVIRDNRSLPSLDRERRDR
jgi:hypothetical protein